LEHAIRIAKIVRDDAFERRTESSERPKHPLGIVALRVDSDSEILRVSRTTVGGKYEAADDEVPNLLGVEFGQQTAEVAAAPQGFHEGPSR
jgi:hypothetical protein